MALLNCPWCGQQAPAYASGENACQGCGRRYTDTAHVREWLDSGSRAPVRHWPSLLRRQLNPLSSRLSPLRVYSDWGVERYYQRTLSDSALAREWQSH